MTLDCLLSLQQLQPRVISVHSYYLTSLVNLAFYSLFARFLFSKSIPQSLSFIRPFPISGKLLCVGTFPLGGRSSLLRLTWNLHGLLFRIQRFVLTNAKALLKFSSLRTHILFSYLANVFRFIPIRLLLTTYLLCCMRDDSSAVLYEP